MAAAASTAPLPFSRFEGTLAEFMMTLRWDTESRRGSRQQLGDNLLLKLMAERTLPTGAYDPAEQQRAGVAVLVSSLSDADLEDIIDEAEERQVHTSWRVAGDETQPPRERLDAHFAPAQEFGVRMREVQAERAALLERQRDENHLSTLRNGITIARQHIENTQAEIDAMESELAAQAERLGCPAWP